MRADGIGPRGGSSAHEEAGSTLPNALHWGLRQIGRDALDELIRACELTLCPPLAPRERRVHELGFLASLLNGRPPDPGRRFSSIARLEYDARRPPDAPSSETLVGRHGGWLRVCALAYGLQPDGSWVGPVRPWTTRRPGTRAPRFYTKEEIRDALRVCAQELGRPPTVEMFDAWGAGRRRRGGAVARTPTHATVFKRYPTAAGGWALALRDAGLT